MYKQNFNNLNFFKRPYLDEEGGKDSASEALRPMELNGGHLIGMPTKKRDVPQ